MNREIVVLRVAPQVKQRLETRARRDHVSANAWITAAIESALAAPAARRAPERAVVNPPEQNARGDRPVLRFVSKKGGL